MAGTLLTTTAITTIVPAAYAGGDDDDGNKNKAEDDSAAATADCDDNDVERAGFDCFGIAANDIDVDLGEGMALGFVDGIPSVYPSN
jgi:glutamate formiminotransferase